jgi:hypothetical protein
MSIAYRLPFPDLVYKVKTCLTKAQFFAIHELSIAIASVFQKVTNDFQHSYGHVLGHAFSPLATQYDF